VPEPADRFAAKLAEHPESERLRQRDATNDEWRDRCTFRQWKRHGRPAAGEGRLAASIRRFVVFRPDSIKLGDKEISVLMQLKTPDDQLHLSIVGVPYKVCSQGYGKIRFYDLSHVFQADADAALNGNSHGSYVATMLCAVKSEATKPK
jgi:hypothetical protein